MSLPPPAARAGAGSPHLSPLTGRGGGGRLLQGSFLTASPSLFSSSPAPQFVGADAPHSYFPQLCGAAPRHQRKQGLGDCASVPSSSFPVFVAFSCTCYRSGLLEAVTLGQPLREQEAKQRRGLAQFRAGPWFRQAVTPARQAPGAPVPTALAGSHRSCRGHRAQGKG